jgi:hypothetical protein
MIMERSGKERVTRSGRRAGERTALDLRETPHEYRSFPTAVKVRLAVIHALPLVSTDYSSVGVM